MSPLRFRTLILFGFWILTALPQGFSATPVFRWYDDQGKVFYSDQVPPKHSKFGRSEINKNGRTVKVVGAAKSKKQIDLRNKFKDLRKQSKSLLASQLKFDHVLLRTFRDVEEIRSNLAGKLSTVEVLININNSNIEQIQTQLEKQERRAARAETNGKKVSKKLLREISVSRQQLKDLRAHIATQEEEKKRITVKYEKDISRFNQLSNQYKNGHKPLSLNWRQQIPEKNNSGNTVSIFHCYKKHTCDTAWQLAKAYIQQNATTDMSVSTEKIIYTYDPRNDQDISLSVSNISEKNNIHKQFFLDLRCKQNVSGSKLCLSEQAQNIRENFKPYIENQLRLGIVQK